MLWQLTDDQLLSLDGHADEKMQAVIDGIKLARSCGADIPLVGEVIAKAQAAGQLRIMYGSGRYCLLCDKSGGYARHTRSGRYHRKGDDNHKRPLSIGGTSFDYGGIFIRGHIDCCRECDSTKGISAKIVDIIVSQELPIELKGDNRNLFAKDDERQCFQCAMFIYESEMGKLRTLMGDGYYPGECPKCGAKSMAFGQSHRHTGKFRMIRKTPAPVEDPTPEKYEWATGDDSGFN